MNNEQTSLSPRQQLLALIEELKLPLTAEEALDHINNLNDEEVSALLPSFEYVKSYQDSLIHEAQHASPDRFALVEATYEKEIRELKEKLHNQVTLAL